MTTQANLNDEAVAAALTVWQLSQPVSLQRIPGGYSSEAWLVETPADQFVAKYTYDSQVGVERGLRGAEILVAHGFPGAAPLRTSTGMLTVPVVGEHGRAQPLSLLHFVPGTELDPSGQDVPELVGGDLGRLHTILLRYYQPPDARARLLNYVSERTPEVAAQPGLQELIDRALAQLHSFEAHMPVTYGWTYGDGFNILCDSAAGAHGWIDWGTLDWGPLLFDIVYAIHMVGGAVQPQRTHRVVEAYLAESPIKPEELRGVDMYAALMEARGAKYFAWRLAHGVTLGNDDPQGNEQSLSSHRRELERLLNGQLHLLEA
jgi:Ser/Thr protein kinase RdoA (MazF antagonist)